jgi:predicted O-methyltransferase YrrM
MNFDEVRDAVAGVPHLTESQGRQLYDFVLSAKPLSVLELGFAHGVSACYIAAALAANGAGRLTTIDLESARERRPDIAQLLDRTGLADRVRPVHTPSSYTWELMRMLEETGPDERPFDFVFIDGAHTWDTDGFAFFLLDRLLAIGGSVLFDDLDWTYATSPTLKDTPFVAALTEQERTTPQVGKVFDLLVRRHPAYGDVRVDGSFGWARKIKA